MLLDIVGVVVPILGMFTKAKKYFEIGSKVLEGANQIRN